MEPLVARLLLSSAAPRARIHAASRGYVDKYNTNRAPRPNSCRLTQHARSFTAVSTLLMKERKALDYATGSHAQPAHKVSQRVTEEEEQHYEKMVEHSKASQLRSPWMREGSDQPPVARQRSAGAMTKGKLLTTPSRMLKLILPLSTKDHNKDRKDVEPLALLVHPQQPLSYLERLIQSELPVLKDEHNNDKIPHVHFRAEDTGEDSISPDKTGTDHSNVEEEESPDQVENADETKIDGKIERTGKISASSKPEESDPTSPSSIPKDENENENKTPNKDVDPSHPNFVRWSPSTEIGDFIRDAARGKEFSIDVEGAPSPIYVAVPSFKDRTYYLRLRLRKTSNHISQLAGIKEDCDKLAHRGAQRVAQGGFAILVGWWYLVYRLTFETELGWDTMEPVTYLVGLSTLIAGYMWFLYHNREVSYRSAMNFTVSRRQSKLYAQRGFDLNKWEGLMEEGNRLRREIKMVADEYDVDWDEKEEEGDDKVVEALRKERKKRNGEGEGEEEEKDDDDDEEGKKGKKKGKAKKVD